jgi:PAS domain S-box-containing protein
MKSPFNRNLRIGYGFSILILLAVSLVSYFTLQNLLDSNRAVSHSSEVMQKMNEVLSVMKDAETGQRGFLLTGRQNYLQPYNGAYKKARNLADEVARLTSDNQSQRMNCLAIRQILDQRLAILQKLIDKKQRGEPIVAADLDAGKSAMDELRSAVAHAEAAERILLARRTEQLNRYTGLVPAFFVFAALLAITITFLSYRNIARDYREKERLRRELVASAEETQALNEELTAANEEISASNEQLTSINDELVEAREQLAAANNWLEEKVAERTRALLDSEQETQALNEELTAINEEMAATNEELMTTNVELAESEQRLQELVDELRQADERSAKLVAIVESSDDAIIGKNLDGIVTSWNRGAQQIFGYTEADMVGQSILKLIPEDLQYEEPIILGRLRNSEKIDHYETTRRRQDGQLIQVSLTISPIHDKEGNVIGVSKIARDITEQKQDEQRKNDFIGMASHELKTPLTSLTALVQVLQQKLKDSSDAFVPQALTKAALQAKKMSSLINGFLNVSRLESGKIEINRGKFELNALISEQLEEIALSISTHTFDFKPLHPVELFADREKIGSVISNLLSNAVKYSPKGKLVTVECSVVENEVLISVKDEGMGIRQHDLAHIFDRYYRVGSEHTRHISGFGVGLYLSAEIVQRHSGRIWVESEKGVGSTFYFTIPLRNND